MTGFILHIIPVFAPNQGLIGGKCRGDMKRCTGCCRYGRVRPIPAKYGSYYSPMDRVLNKI